MDRLTLLAPALLLLTILSITFVIYVGRCAVGRAPRVLGIKHNQFFGPYLARYLIWVMGPVERALIGRVTPNQITALSLAMCGGCGVAAGLGHLGLAAWLFTLAGMLDIIDGRLARRLNQQTAAGALFDSVSDRWGELFALTGYAWYLRDSPWLLAVMGVISSSMMVSYTRARAEGLKVEISGGLMQRAERISLLSIGSLVAGWFASDPLTADRTIPVIGGTMVLCAIASTATAVGRWIAAHRALAARDAIEPPPREPELEVEPEPAAVRAPEIFPVPKALRESAELPM